MSISKTVAVSVIAAGFISSAANADTLLCSKRQGSWVTVAMKSSCVEDRCSVSAPVYFTKSTGDGYYCGETAFSGTLCTNFFGRKLVFKGGRRINLD